MPAQLDRHGKPAVTAGAGKGLPTARHSPPPGCPWGIRLAIGPGHGVAKFGENVA